MKSGVVISLAWPGPSSAAQGQLRSCSAVTFVCTCLQSAASLSLSKGNWSRNISCMNPFEQPYTFMNRLHVHTSRPQSCISRLDAHAVTGILWVLEQGINGRRCQQPSRLAWIQQQHGRSWSTCATTLRRLRLPCSRHSACSSSSQAWPSRCSFSTCYMLCILEEFLSFCIQQAQLQYKMYPPRKSESVELLQAPIIAFVHAEDDQAGRSHLALYAPGVCWGQPQAICWLGCQRKAHLTVEGSMPEVQRCFTHAQLTSGSVSVQALCPQ